MKVFRTLLIILLLGLPTMGWAQERVPVTFYLVDGSELNGYVTPFARNAKTFTYSTEPDGKLERMKLAQVHRMVTFFGEMKLVYEVVNVLNPVSDQVKDRLILRLLEEGYMNLYHFQYELHEYYLKPKPEAKGVYAVAYAELGSSKLADKGQKTWNKRFQKNAAKYFIDHPEISQEFAAGTIDTKKIKALVIRYNQFKAAQ